MSFGLYGTAGTHVVAAERAVEASGGEEEGWELEDAAEGEQGRVVVRDYDECQEDNVH